MKILSYIHLCALSILMPFLGTDAFAQDGPMRDLSLSETSELALAGNWTILKSEKYKELSYGDLKQSRAVFLPSVRLSENFTTTTDPLMVFGFKLKQEITELSDFDPELLNNPERIENFNTRIEVSQPLLNMDGIWERKAAETATRISEKNHEWTEQMIVLESKAMYFQLILAKRQKDVFLQSLDAAKANRKETNDLFDQGMVTRADVLGAELRVIELESQLIAAENQVFKANSDLAHFLNLENGTLINPIDEIDIFEFDASILNQTDVSESRADLSAMALQKEASEYQLKSFKNSNLPRLNLMGSYEWNDADFTLGGASNYLVGASLQWDIFKGGTRSGKVQQALAQKNLADLQYSEKLSNSTLEVQQLQNKVKLAAKQYKLSELAVKQASESNKIISDRYKEGLEKTSDLLNADAALIQKKIKNIQHLNQYQQLVFRLEVLLEENIVTQ